jgi:hypothetical protein
MPKAAASEQVILQLRAVLLGINPLIWRRPLGADASERIAKGMPVQPRVAESIRRGSTPCSTYSASCRRRNRFSASIDRFDRSTKPHQRTASAAN